MVKLRCSVIPEWPLEGREPLSRLAKSDLANCTPQGGADLPTSACVGSCVLVGTLFWHQRQVWLAMLLIGAMPSPAMLGRDITRILSPWEAEQVPFPQTVGEFQSSEQVRLWWKLEERLPSPLCPVLPEKGNNISIQPLRHGHECLSWVVHPTTWLSTGPSSVSCPMSQETSTLGREQTRTQAFV